MTSLLEQCGQAVRAGECLGEPSRPTPQITTAGGPVVVVVIGEPQTRTDR
jgi:hypothetical protein